MTPEDETFIEVCTGDISMKVRGDVYLTPLPDGKLGGNVIVDGTFDVLCHPKASPSHPLQLRRGTVWVMIFHEV